MTHHLVLGGLCTMLLCGCSAAQPVARATPPAEPLSQPSATTQPATETEFEPGTQIEPETVVSTWAEDEPAPATQAARVVEPIAVLEQPATLVQQFDAELLRLLHDEPAAEPFADLAGVERELCQGVVDAIADFRRALQDESGLLSAKTRPLLNLAEQVRARTPLDLPTLALCRSVSQFGVYDAFEPARFTAGRETPVIVYCEVDHFRSNVVSDGRWETKLNYEATLYSDGDHALAVISKKPTTVVDRCRNRRRDFFLADRMTLPGNLPVGRYVLKVTVIDQLANQVAERTIPLQIAPN